MAPESPRLEAAIRQLVSRVAAEAGVELVELELRGTRQRRVLRVDIDRAGARGVGIEDCQRVSRTLGIALDEADLIPSRYVLEVSSPGLDRPLCSEDDFRRNTGRPVKVEATDRDGGRQSYRGRLAGYEQRHLRITREDEEEIRIPLDSVVSVRQEVEF